MTTFFERDSKQVRICERQIFWNKIFYKNFKTQVFMKQKTEPNKKWTTFQKKSQSNKILVKYVTTLLSPLNISLKEQRKFPSKFIAFPMTLPKIILWKTFPIGIL